MFPDVFNSFWWRDQTAEDDSKHLTEQFKGTSAVTSGLGYFSETRAEQTAMTPSLELYNDSPGSGASDSSVLAQRDFRFVFNAADMRQIERSIDIIARQIKKRTRRRYRASNGRNLDLRRTCRQSLKHEGWTFDLAFRKRRLYPAKFLLLLDVSQSMEVYSYLFLRFTRALAQKFRSVEAFAFHTELVHIGDELREKNTNKLERKLKEISSGWLGGTKIAESLGTFNRQFARQTVCRQTIVLIFSDGYDSGNPVLLRRQVLQIKSQCRKVVWVNPLLGRDTGNPSELPIERAMKLVVPLVDMYASAHNLRALKDLAPAFSY